MGERAARKGDLNHPYAYDYVIAEESTHASGSAAPPPLERPSVGPWPEVSAAATSVQSIPLEISGDVEGQVASSSSYVSTVISAAVHMVLLVVAGLLFSTLPRPSYIEIVLSKAIVESTEQMETFVMDAEPDAPVSEEAIQSDPVVAEPVLEIVEPTLTSVAEVEVSERVTAPGDAAAPSPNPGKSGKGSQFFGMAAAGNRFVYIVDISGSMSQRSSLSGSEELAMRAAMTGGRLQDLQALTRNRQTRFDIARDELLRSIDQLEEDQSFCVILFSSDTKIMFEQFPPSLIEGTESNKERIGDWMDEVGTGGGTEPNAALKAGFQLQPDAVFLLSDGEFSGRKSVESIVRRFRDKETTLHTIAFESPSNRGRLRRLAESTKGRHRYVGSHSKQSLVIADIRSGNQLDVQYAIRQILDAEVSFSNYEKATIGLICCEQMRSRNLASIKLAHECMVAIGDGADFGPSNRGRQRVVVLSANRWAKHWRDMLKDSPRPRR